MQNMSQFMNWIQCAAGCILNDGNQTSNQKEVNSFPTQPSRFMRGKILALALLVPPLFSSARGAEDAISHPFPGISYHVETRQEPPMRLFIAEVDLADPHVHVRVAPGGPDPDGPGKWQTTLMQPTIIAAREYFDLVVNGDFFKALAITNAEGAKSRYRADVWGAAVGPAVTDGKIWSTGTTNRPCLVVSKNQKVSIKMLGRPSRKDWEIISGNTLLLKDGVAVSHKNQKREPRTVVGIDAKGKKLIIMVVDGRKPGISIGMSYDELAAEMFRLGCRQALNLDGGGSSVMAIRDSVSGEMHILNTPSDGHERAVANALGVWVDKQQSDGVAPKP